VVNWLNSRTWKIRTARDLSLIALLLVAACTTDRTRRGYLRRAAEGLAPPERVVIVIPGFGVTRLFDPVSETFVWGTPRATMRTRYADDLDLPHPDAGAPRDRLVPRGYVGSRGPVNVGWQLMEALRKYGGYIPGETVHPFHYDWRLSARVNAEALGRLVEEVSAGRNVDVITHSAGAIVALTWIKLGGGRDRVDRLILIAPTQRGVIDAFRIFVRPERFLRRRFEPAMVATWPFVYELFPEDGRFILDGEGKRTEFDVWRPETWPVESLDLPVTEHVRAGRALRDDLASAAMPPSVQVTTIAGDCVPTASRILRRADGSYAFYPEELKPEERPLASALFAPGDGTVPVSSAAPDASATFFCDGHQGIAADPNVHRALIRALRGR
jgi:hypothetical protein